MEVLLSITDIIISKNTCINFSSYFSFSFFNWNNLFHAIYSDHDFLFPIPLRPSPPPHPPNSRPLLSLSLANKQTDKQNQPNTIFFKKKEGKKHKRNIEHTHTHKPTKSETLIYKQKTSKLKKNPVWVKNFTGLCVFICASALLYWEVVVSWKSYTTCGSYLHPLIPFFLHSFLNPEGRDWMKISYSGLSIKKSVIFFIHVVQLWVSVCSHLLQEEASVMMTELGTYLWVEQNVVRSLFLTRFP